MPAPATDLAPALVLPISDRDHRRGTDGAPLTLVQYGDYACAFCTEAHPAIETLQAALAEHLCFAYRHFPVNSPRRSRPAARAAEIAAQQGAFWPMHDALSAETGAALDEARLFELAGELDLDLDRFRRAFEDGAGSKRLTTDYESAVESGVRRTPSFFLNGYRLDTPHHVADVLSHLALDDTLRADAEEHLQVLHRFL